MDVAPIKSPIEVLWQDPHMVAVVKPAGYHVHQPEFPRPRVVRDIVMMLKLRQQLQRWIFPVHRLDVATSGVLLFALSKEAAGGLCRQFEVGDIEKKYLAVVRGWPPDSGVVDLPLRSDSSDCDLESKTSFRTLSRCELPFAVGKRHSSARYALIEATPHTGRFHQIRRHMARIHHPIIGDAAHGDSYHNRFLREHIGRRGLWLFAQSLRVNHPLTNVSIEFSAPLSDDWKRGLRDLDLGGW